MSIRNIRSWRIRLVLSVLPLLAWFATGTWAEGGLFGGGIRERMQERREKRQSGDTGTAASEDKEVKLEKITKAYKVRQLDLGPGDYTRDIEGPDKRSRFFDLHVPASYSKDKPLPLILNFHGGAGNPHQQRRDTLMDAAADKYGYIIVYPAGTSALGKFLTWNIGLTTSYATSHNVDDLGYVKNLIDDVSKMFNIDEKRIYATGYSQGGMMSYRLACEMSDTIAAIAPVGAVMQVPEEQRKVSRPVPIIHFHGLKDPNVLYEGGGGKTPLGEVSRPSVKDTISWWAKHNKVADSKAGKPVGQAEPTHYGNEGDAGEIILWTLKDGGHTWPGGKSSVPEDRVGPINMDINATELMFQFFNKHRLP